MESCFTDISNSIETDIAIFGTIIIDEQDDMNHMHISSNFN